MTLDELQNFIEERDKIFRDAQSGNISEKERVLARTVKLFEEAGELCDEILGSMGYQRKEKLENRQPEGIAEEFADVVITLFLLGKTLNVDISSSLENKIKKIRQRDPVKY